MYWQNKISIGNVRKDEFFPCKVLARVRQALLHPWVFSACYFAAF